MISYNRINQAIKGYDSELTSVLHCPSRWMFFSPLDTLWYHARWSLHLIKTVVLLWKISHSHGQRLHERTILWLTLKVPLAIHTEKRWRHSSNQHYLYRDNWITFNITICSCSSSWCSNICKIRRTGNKNHSSRAQCLSIQVLSRILKLNYSDTDLPSFFPRGSSYFTPTQ